MAHPCPGMGERIGRARVRELIGQDKDSLEVKEREKEINKPTTDAINHSPSPTSRPMASQSLSNSYHGRQHPTDLLFVCC